MEEEQSIRLWFETAGGEEHEFELIGSFVEGGRDYAALHPMDDPEENVILMGVEFDDEGQPVFIPIDDKEEYETLGAVFEALFNGEAEITPLPDSDEWGEPYGQEDVEDYCYEDAEGRLFLYGPDGEIIYLDENGEPVEEI